MPPLAPMLAKPADEVPDGEGWLYEPKWDGFRCIVFRDGEEVLLASRNERPFNRYFPELLDPIRAQFPQRCVVDGEIVVPAASGAGLDFDALQQRIHPAESRVRRLAVETPSAFIAFDLIAVDGESLLGVTLAARRARLDDVLSGLESPLHLTPATTEAAVARDWFARFEGAGLDGVLAKPLPGVYTPGERSLVKVKHRRTADCVVAGYRRHKDGKGVGSFLLGLYDDESVLHHVGVASGINARQRASLLAEIAPLEEGALVNHPWREWADAVAHAAGGRMPGAPSRWNANKDLSWSPLRLERVCEVEFTQLEGRRFRHNAHFLHWRPDRSPHDCRYDQLDVAVPATLREVLEAPR